ncbi:MAG: hypothetical protein NTX03_14315 [Bacteroidetes bacterium]|nr:hypothetical protein [Bacteroidota bacterium]
MSNLSFGQENGKQIQKDSSKIWVAFGYGNSHLFDAYYPGVNPMRTVSFTSSFLSEKGFITGASIKHGEQLDISGKLEIFNVGCFTAGYALQKKRVILSSEIGMSFTQGFLGTTHKFNQKSAYESVGFVAQSQFLFVPFDRWGIGATGFLTTNKAVTIAGITANINYGILR